jgi:hypothetical protein
MAVVPLLWPSFGLGGPNYDLAMLPAASVADPDPFYTGPDLAFHFDMDPDPPFQFDRDPYPAI